jgi:ABC-type branched-subunit amino acid transport system permease subunit
MHELTRALVSIVTGLFTLGEADLTTIGINMIMGLSMFLPMTVGQLSFGQAGFMSIGAHIAVVLTLYAGVWFPVALLVAGLGAGLIGFLVGVPVLRLRGLLLALVTFAFAQVVEVFFLNFKPTGAAEGIRGIFPHTDLWYVYGFLALVIVFLARLRHSRMGRAFEAVKLDETAAEAMGVNVTRAKLMAFSTGAFVAGVGGASTRTTLCSSSTTTSTSSAAWTSPCTWCWAAWTYSTGRSWGPSSSRISPPPCSSSPTGDGKCGAASSS